MGGGGGTRNFSFFGTPLSYRVDVVRQDARGDGDAHGEVGSRCIVVVERHRNCWWRGEEKRSQGGGEGREEAEEVRKGERGKRGLLLKC